MQSTRLPLLAFALVAVACASTSEAEAPAPEINMAEIEFPVPVEQHQAILADVGSWEGTLTSYIPGSPPEPVFAKEDVVAVGGFWVQSRFQCDFMGQVYTGTGCVGYDTEAGVYRGTWIDSMGSHLSIMEGAMEDGVLVMRWATPDPVTGESVPHRSETVHHGDRRVMTFYMGEGDDEMKSMEIDLTRK